MVSPARMSTSYVSLMCAPCATSRAARGEPSAVATTGLVASLGGLPIVAMTALGCVTLNAAITVLSAAAAIAPAAVLTLLPPAASRADVGDDHADAMSFWNGGGYMGDWIPTDVGENEEEGHVQRTIRVATPLVVLAVMVVVALANSGDDRPASGSDTGPGVDPLPDGGA